MSERAFWLLISVTIVMIGFLLMLIGFTTTDRGGWACVIGLLTICTGAVIGGLSREE